VLRRQTDGYCILPGEGASKQKNLDCGPHPASPSIKVSLRSFLLDSFGIPPEQKKRKAAMIHVLSDRFGMFSEYGCVKTHA